MRLGSLGPHQIDAHQRLTPSGHVKTTRRNASLEEAADPGHF